MNNENIKKKMKYTTAIKLEIASSLVLLFVVSLPLSYFLNIKSERNSIIFSVAIVAISLIIGDRFRKYKKESYPQNKLIDKFTHPYIAAIIFSGVINRILEFTVNKNFSNIYGIGTITAWFLVDIVYNSFLLHQAKKFDLDNYVEPEIKVSDSDEYVNTYDWNTDEDTTDFTYTKFDFPNGEFEKEEHYAPPNGNPNLEGNKWDHPKR